MNLSRAKRRLLLVDAARRIRRAGCWFVDIPRTSSTSIKSELHAAFGPFFAKSDGARSRDELLLRDHLQARRVRDMVGQRTWSGIFTFTVVRNPWDRMASLYRYRLRADDIPPDLTFTSYVELLARSRGEGLFHYPGHYMSCIDFITDSHGEEMVSFIARYERRATDLATISERIGLPRLGQTHLYGTNGSVHYSRYYTPTTRDIIADVYADDIERFDYVFQYDEPATYAEGPGAASGSPAAGHRTRPTCSS